MTAPTVPPRAAVDGSVDIEAPADAKPRRRLRVRRPPFLAPPAWLLGLVGVAVALAVGLVVAAIPMTLIWITSGEAGLTWVETLRGSALLLAIAHGTPVVVGTVTYSVVPWGFVLLPAALLAWSAGWVARRGSVSGYRQAAVLVVVMSIGYAVGMTAIARIGVLGPANVSEVAVLVHALAVALVATAIGVVRAADVAMPTGPVAVALFIVARAAAVGLLALVSIGAVAGAASLIAHIDEAIDMTQSLHPGAWGGLLLLLVGLGYVPVLVVWSASYVIGAGVVIGPAIVVSPFVPATAPTQLPPFPMLAAVPQSAGPLAWALPVLGIVAGVLVGLTISRRARREPRLLRLGMAAGAALLTGLAMAVLAYLASGSLGDLRLAAVGPVPSTVGILAAVLALLGAVPAAVVAPSAERPALRTTESVPEPTMEGDDDV